MFKLAVIGDSDSIALYRCLGIVPFEAQTVEETQEAIKQIKNDDYAVCFITEKAASMVVAEIDKLSQQKTPAIIYIPGVSDNTGIGMQQLTKAVERAVGSDILKDK